MNALGGKLLEPWEVAEHLGKISADTVVDWAQRGELRGFKIGGKWRFSIADVEAYKEEHQNRPPRGRELKSA